MTYASEAFAALGDTTRRTIFERIAMRPQAVGEIARALPVSRPAVSQHLRALKHAGLVLDRAQGTRRIYYVAPEGLEAIRKWLDQFWDASLQSFKAEVERNQPEREQ